MEESVKKSGFVLPWWSWFVIPASALLLWKLFRNTARGANRLTEDLTDSESQAVKFYGYFGVYQIAGQAFATPVLRDSTKQQIGWLARNINDWSVVQRAFTTLCGGNYTIFDAAKLALNTTDFNSFVTLITNALTQPRIFATTDYAHTLYNPTPQGGQLAETFKNNAFVGRCISEDNYYYYYISCRDGVKYAASKDDFKTV